MAHMKPSQWAKYESVMNEWQEDAFQQPIVWKRLINAISPHGEDDNETFDTLEVLGLIQYNNFRAWPITQATDTGEIDKESCMVFLNIKYLRDLGYTNQNDQFEFDPAMDRFLINGVTYKAMGDSQVSQAHNKPLFLFIILKREETPTGSNVY